MKIFKKLITFTLAILMCCTVCAAAEGDIMPLYENISTVDSSFSIDENGLSTVKAKYQGWEGVTTLVEVRIKLEKKTLWWWSEVDNGWDDNTFYMYSTQYYNEFVYTEQLDSTGTYRATVEFTIYGTGADAEVITQTSEYKY